MDNYNLICIIDDDPIYIFGVRRLMNNVNFSKQITVYNNGKEAIDGLKATINSNADVPEVIFLDLNMPVMDGWQFLDEFTKIPSTTTITIYVVTSSIDPNDMDRIKNYKAVNNYIIKPISSDKLFLLGRNGN